MAPHRVTTRGVLFTSRTLIGCLELILVLGAIPGVQTEYPKCGEGLSYQGLVFFRQMCYCDSRERGAMVVGCDVFSLYNRTQLKLHFLSSKLISSNFKIMNMDNVTFNRSVVKRGRKYHLVDLAVGSTELSHFSNLISRLKNLSIRVESLSVSGAVDLDPSDFQKVLQMTKGTLNRLQIFRTFEDSSLTIDLSGLKQLRALMLRENRAAIRLNDSVQLNLVEVEDQPMANDRVNIYINRSQPDEYNKEVVIDWNSNSVWSRGHLTPHFYSSPFNLSINGTFAQQNMTNVTINIRHNRYIQILKKDSFMYLGRVRKLCLPPNLYLVEYGSLSSGEQMATELLSKSDEGDEGGGCMKSKVLANFSDLAVRDLWVKGKCKFLKSEFVCQLCFMHQFGLHKYDDNVTELCAEENLEKPYNGPRQACFWEDIEPLPPSLKHMEEQVQKPTYSATAIRHKLFCPPEEAVEKLNMTNRMAKSTLKLFKHGQKIDEEKYNNPSANGENLGPRLEAGMRSDKQTRDYADRVFKPTVIVLMVTSVLMVAINALLE